MTATQKKTILFTWIGNNDRKAMSRNDESVIGPIARVFNHRRFDHVVLLSDHKPLDQSRMEEAQKYSQWLCNRLGQNGAKVELREFELNDPTDFGAVYTKTIDTINDYLQQDEENQFRPSFLLSPGTSAMYASFLFIGKSVYPAELLETAEPPKEEFRVTHIPLSVIAEYEPPYIPEDYQKLNHLPPEILDRLDRAFQDLICESESMKKCIHNAKVIVSNTHDEKILILGERGTGKSSLARAIHEASYRFQKPFKKMTMTNSELSFSELFGHVKGSFTGAAADRKGIIEEAENGTVFLDEIGEAPPKCQIELLQVLQEKVYRRLGDSKERKAECRFIFATNADLEEKMDRGEFRRDLFDRINEIQIVVPPLRERKGDIPGLIKHFLQQKRSHHAILSREISSSQEASRQFSQEALNVLLSYHWPGNVRELENLIGYCHAATTSTIIPEEVVLERIENVQDSRKDIFNRPLGEEKVLDNVCDEIRRHYILRAQNEAKTVKKQAQLLGWSINTYKKYAKQFGLD